MSFVNLMGNVTFTETQIIKRTEAMIRSKYSVDAENILNRKLTGVLLGDYTLSDSEMMEVSDYQSTVIAAKQEAAAARADNELLKAIIAYEKALARLAQIELSVGRPEQLAVDATYDEFGVELTPAVPYIAPIEPVPTTVEVTDEEGVVTTVPNPVVVTDEAERADAQAVVDSVTAEVLDLHNQRNG